MCIWTGSANPDRVIQMVRHKTFRKRSASSGLPNVEVLEGVVHPQILHAMRVASAKLRDSGIRHALVGGLAVGAHGYPRSTRDVDFLVGAEAFKVHGGGLVTINPGVPIAVGDIGVDPISIADGEEYLDQALDSAMKRDIVPVLPIEPLIYLKMKSLRKKDASDVIELIKQGVDPDPVVTYLMKHASDLVEKFAELVNVALSEEE
jgi:hypothetical protein